MYNFYCHYLELYSQEKIKIAVEQNTEAQKQLYQLSKEAELEKMIANISHQWRGPLTKIGAINLELLLKMRIQNQENISLTEFKDKFEEIEKLVNFMSITMQRFFRNFTNHQNKKKSPFILRTYKSSNFYFRNKK